MATVVLQTIGAAAGQFIGGPIGAIAGQTAGAIAGATIDQRLLGPKGANGPRLSAMPAMGSTEGATIPVVFGRARVGGQVIWATRFEEKGQSQSGKGVGSPSRKTYSYFANFAVGLCEGEIAGVRRIWADGKEIDQTKFAIRVYRGREDQDADALIVAKEGAENAPAYRGLAYVVFERMPLAEFGDRIPQLSFEVARPANALAPLVRGVDIIPGAGEFVYSNRRTLAIEGYAGGRSINRNNLVASSDWTASLDALEQSCPNVGSAALVVSWFGDDLRAGHCTIAPRVDTPDKITRGSEWRVAGVARASARAVSSVEGRPAYGGTPSDNSVVEAINDLRARNLSVVFYPFVMMDIPAANTLADPWSGAEGQPAYPWRGRLTCDPAPGRAGSPDGTDAAASQVASFFGAGDPHGDEWTYRRFILHYARLCADAGGVDAFIIGSEFVSLTRVRSAGGVYPAVAALAALAHDVKEILGPACKVSYAADWTEYGAHVREAGAEVRFPLDTLWASPAIDFIGVDYYPPLSDWRDGDDHLDAHVASSIYDVAYLRERVASGEAFDWFYEDQAARDAQTRTPIVDGACGKHWVFRQKDLVGWWSNLHFDRSGGAELAEHTAWTPCSKPIWLTEIGCPAVDRGANAPNVFPDPKSFDGGLPCFSRGFPDDLMQARALEAIISRFDPSSGAFEAAHNPLSPLYGGHMVDPSRIHVWAWDARPWPAFPHAEDQWSDGVLWRTGHWLNGRIDSVDVDLLAKLLCKRALPGGDTAIRADTRTCIDGYVLDRPVSARDALEPLAAIFAFDGTITGGEIRFEARAAKPVRNLTEDDIVPGQDGEPVLFTRGQDSELPRRLSLSFHDGESEYRPATVHARRIEGASMRETVRESALVTTRAKAQQRCDVMLQDAWIERETARFRLRAGLPEIEIGDLLTLPGAPLRSYRITRMAEGLVRDVEAHMVVRSIYDSAPPDYRRPVAASAAIAGPLTAHVFSLALHREGFEALQYAAVYADPWPGAVGVWRQSGRGFDDIAIITRRATIGVTLDELRPGVTSRFDRANSFSVRIVGGALSSLDDVQALSGARALAVGGPDGAWEVLVFGEAELVGAGVWRLSRLVRGLGGEDHLSKRLLTAGAPVVLLDEAVTPLERNAGRIGVQEVYRFADAAADHADDLAVEVFAPVRDVALKPYAPVHPRARRVSGGVEISFIRRGRIDADGWGLAEIPLGEERETYRIEILDGAILKRVLATAAPSVVYTGEVADFGSPQTALRLRIAQVSATVGAGFACTHDVRID
ncbi:MAG: glycoside hydrolase/phage tail family protein [Beijerinckiaceae bacterium]